MEQINEIIKKEINLVLEISSKAKLPTKFGDFTIYAFDVFNTTYGPISLVKGDLENKEDILVRLHSECLTGDVFDSQRCDCGYQLQKSMEIISEEGNGIIIYLRQEGRGIGLQNKIKAYSLQDKGHDTVEANHLLGFKTDERNYLLGALILKRFKVESIRLLTNNRKKVDAMTSYGILVKERVPIIPLKTKENNFYLQTKKTKMNHLI